MRILESSSGAGILASVLLAILVTMGGGARACTHVIGPSPDAALIIGPSQVEGLRAGDTLCLMAGHYRQILVRNIHGTSDSAIVIRNHGGQLTLANDAHYGIAFHNSSFIRLLGDGSSQYPYGIFIQGVAAGNGISVDRLSTNVEIAHVEISNTGMSGIMVKTDPRCDDLSSVRDSFALHDTRIHHNHIHHTFNEGIYVGSSYYYPGFPLTCNGQDTLVLPHEMIGVSIHNNLIERTGRNALQVSSAPVDCHIFNNTILEDSQSGIQWHMNGIQVGGGSRCEVYNNRIINGRGSGIHFFGRGPAKIFNNLIVNPGRSHHPDLPPNQSPVYGILVKDIYTDTPDPLHILHNTIVSPRTEGIQYDNVQMAGSLIQNNIVVNPGGFQYTGNSSFVNVACAETDALVSHNYLSLLSETIRFKDTLQHDYSLQNTSPVINAGTNAIPMGIDFDITGAPRPFGPASDIGAYEYQGFPAFADESEKQRVRVFPNPVTSQFSMILPYQAGVIQSISLYDPAGRRVLFIRRVEDCLPGTIDISHLAGGLYYIRIEHGDEYTSGSLIKH